MTHNRIPLIAGNWKMYKTGSEAVDTARRLVESVNGTEGVEAMIAPPYTALSETAGVLSGSNIMLGAQNVHWEPEGAFTGEVSLDMIKALDCRYVIIGHSERRQYFGETDEAVNKKVVAVADAGLNPILCIGETERERKTNITFSVLDKQIKMGLHNHILGDLSGKLVVAYEPVWAIGTGLAATSEQAQEVHEFIRSVLKKLYGSKFADETRILYGGSVKPNNVNELMQKPDIDGALVGGASLDADTFSRLVRFGNNK